MLRRCQRRHVLSKTTATQVARGKHVDNDLASKQMLHYGSVNLSARQRTRAHATVEVPIHELFV